MSKLKKSKKSNKSISEYVFCIHVISDPLLAVGDPISEYQAQSSSSIGPDQSHANQTSQATTST